ncbi:dipeptidyl peptidase IV N-terminal region-domain-containing protein [Phycomyces nitens]|nr:dipeptidyl peptidase IV N-terminal region-domain-containing protein [Phycomyces nitens]
MIFDATPIINDVVQLNQDIFENTHRELEQTLESFAAHFDSFDTTERSLDGHVSSCLIGPDKLASNYVQLTGCLQILQSSRQNISAWDTTIDAASRTNAAMKDLETVVVNLDKSGTKRVEILEHEKALFVAEIEKQRAQLAQEFRRKQDQLEELYANKTRQKISVTILPPVMSKTYTWDQIRGQVRSFRAATQASLSPQALATIKDFHFDDTRQRLTFLANQRSSESCLSRNMMLYRLTLNAHVTTHSKDCKTASDSKEHAYLHRLVRLPLLPWAPIAAEYIDPDDHSPIPTRHTLHGISSFEYLHDKAIFTFAGAVYVSQRGETPLFLPFRNSDPVNTSNPCCHSLESPQISPNKCILDSGNSKPGVGHKSLDLPVRADPKLGGFNTNFIAFTRDNDIWVADLEGYETQLTFCSLNAENATMSCGVAEYVMQEEFRRFTGYYWGPCDANINQILYLETSEDNVDTVMITTPNAPVNTYPTSSGPLRYPRAGRPNASSVIHIVTFDFQAKKIIRKRLWDMSIETLFPWTEYIVRFGWLPDMNSVWVQILSRDQKKTKVLRIPVSLFLSPQEYELQKLSSTKSDAEIEILWEETTDTWINISDTYHFLDSHQNSTQFIWSSEKSGYRHLYFVTKTFGESKPSIVQLTDGEWCVVDKPLFVDESRRLVYFMGKKDTPLECHLYVTNYAPTSSISIARLTELGFSHNVTVFPSSGIFVDCFSNLECYQVIILCRLGFDTLDGLPVVVDDNTVRLTSVPIMKTHPEHTLNCHFSKAHIPVLSLEPFPSMDIPKSKVFEFLSHDGVKLYGCLYKPLHYTAGTSFRTVLHIYGGPKSQMVTNDFRFPRLLRYLMSVYFGFAVVIIDGRGSCDRGLAFEAGIKNRLGTIELMDQIDGLNFLANTKFGAEPTPDGNTVSVIDMSRIAITGWSYGGYLSLMGLAKHPSIFKLAIAGAPVTQWELYDSAYTERYIGLPSENPSAYSIGSILNKVERFPDCENRLLIAHGLIDENVHFRHTESLVSLLVKFNKPHYLQVYPTEKHGLRHASVNEHFETLMFYWLMNYL